MSVRGRGCMMLLLVWSHVASKGMGSASRGRGSASLPPCEQNAWQALLKTLPSFAVGDKRNSHSIGGIQIKVLPHVFFCEFQDFYGKKLKILLTQWGKDYYCFSENYKIYTTAIFELCMIYSKITNQGTGYIGIISLLIFSCRANCAN